VALAGCIAAGRSGEPARESGNKLAELVGLLDNKRPVEGGKQRGKPVEPLGLQLDVEPPSVLLVRWQLFHGCDAGGEPGADLLDGALDAQDDFMPVGGPGESGLDMLGRVESGGWLERAGQGPGVRDAIDRNVRSSPTPGSAPVTYQRPEWATSPYGCEMRSLRRPSRAMPWGNRSLLFRDPDGNLVNFFTPVTPAAIDKFAHHR
jgi:hypothetical protein